MKFYNGTNTIVPFNKIFRLIQPFLTDVIYWKESKHTKTLAKSGIVIAILLRG